MQDNIQTTLSKLSIQIIFLSLLNKKGSINLQPIQIKSFSTPAKRPKYNVLDKTKIKSTFGPDVSGEINNLEERLK